MLGSALNKQMRKVLGATYAIVRRGPVYSREAEESLEGCHRLPAAIMPKDKLVQVDLELGPADPMVSADEPLLEVTDSAVGKWDHRLCTFAQFGSQRLSARDMLKTDFLQAIEALEAVGVDCGTGSNVPSDEAVDGYRPKVRDDSHADAARGPSTLLNRDQDQCCSPPLELTAPSDTGLGTAPPRVVDLDLTPKRFASEVHRCSSELVEHHPSGFVTPKPKLALEKQCRNTPLVGGHQIGGPEPKGQGSLGIVKDGARSERDLVATGGTLPASPSHQRVAMSMGASGTLETLWPAARGQVLLAGFLAGKLKLKLAKRLRKGWSRHPLTLQLVVC